MNQSQQYYGVIAIRIIYIILGSLIFLFLFYDSVNADSRIFYSFSVITLFEAIFMCTSILATVIHASCFFFAKCEAHVLKVENKPLLWSNIIIGIIAFFYRLFKLVDNNLSMQCYQWYETFNNVAKMGFTLSLFLYLLITVQWKPDPDEREITLSAIGSGYLAFLGCVFICGRHLAKEIQKILNGGSTLPNCNSEFHSFFLQISKVLEIFEILFTMISGIFIFFRLQESVRHIMKRQYYYTIMKNTPRSSNTSSEEHSRSSLKDHRRYLWLQLFLTNKISILITFMLASIIFSFSLLVFIKLNTRHNVYINVGVVIIMILNIALPIWCLAEVVKCPIEKKIRSKIDDFILLMGTMAQLFFALVLINYYIFYTDSTSFYSITLVILHVVYFVQIGIQRFLILEILQRKITDMHQVTSGCTVLLRRYINPFLNLCVVNFLSFIFLTLIYIYDFPFPHYDLALVIVMRFLIPFLIVTRLHASTILLQVLLILNLKIKSDLLAL